MKDRKRFRLLCQKCGADYLQIQNTIAPGPPVKCGQCFSTAIVIVTYDHTGHRIPTPPPPAQPQQPQPDDTIEQAIGRLLDSARAVLPALENGTPAEVWDVAGLRNAIEDVETWIAMEDGDYELRRAALDSSGRP